MNPYLEQILGQGPAAEAEGACAEAFVKQASAEKIDLATMKDEDVNELYENVFKPKWAELQAQPVSSASVIEKAAAEGASDEVLDKLSMARLEGIAQAEGYLDTVRVKLAQAEGGEPLAPAGDDGAPPAGGGEGGGGEEETEEAAKAIVQAAVDEAIDEASEAAESQGVQASPEELAQAAAPMVEQKVEEKTGAWMGYWESQGVDFEKDAGAKETAGKVYGKAKNLVNKAGRGIATAGRAVGHAGAWVGKGVGKGAVGAAKGIAWGAKHPAVALPVAAATGAAATFAAMHKKKHAAELLTEFLKDAGEGVSGKVVETPVATPETKGLFRRIGKGLKGIPGAIMAHPGKSALIGGGAAALGLGAYEAQKHFRKQKAAELLTQFISENQ